MRSIRVAGAIAATTLLLAGCGAQPFIPNVRTTVAAPDAAGDAAAETSSSPTAGAAVPPTAGLIAAMHPDCARLGSLVFTYMMTGDTGGDAQLDHNLADARARLLSQPDESRTGLARQQADTQIAYCDDQLVKAENAQAAASQAAARAAQQAAEEAATKRREERAEAARQATYAKTCRKHHGTPSGTGWGQSCTVTYSDGEDSVPMNQDGTFDQSSADSQRDSCTSEKQSALDAERNGFPWTQQPVYHADTGVCVQGTP